MQTKIKKIKILLLLILLLPIYFFHGNKPTKTTENPIEESKNFVSSDILVSDSDNSDNQKNSNSLRSTPENISQVNLSPRQQEISKLVNKEIEYRILTMNDPLSANSWHLNKIKTAETWAEANSTNTSTVAVIDSGFALDHEDLTNKWAVNEQESGNTNENDNCWTGTPEPKRSNNCDDDSNGYVDDWKGWDFYYVDNLPNAGSNNPQGNGAAHGTEVSGLVGAESNNNIGIASIGYTNKIMPLQVMNDDGIGYTSDIISAIYYAVDNGADVINMSLGSAYSDDAMKNALNYASENNVIIVAAAGNCGDSPTDGICEYIDQGTITYPARYNNVIAVGSVDQNNQKSSFSSFGSELDIVAPGEGNIESTSWASGNQTSAYKSNLYGTSFSSPLVASLAGLVKSHNTDLSVEVITSIIVANSFKTIGMESNIFNDNFGHGLLDGYQAITYAKLINPNSPKPSLLHTGNQKSESQYTNSSTISAGCQTTNGQLCSIMLKQINGKNKFLPYKLITNSTVNWSWNTSILKSSTWELKSLSGNSLSDTKIIYNK